MIERGRERESKRECVKGKRKSMDYRVVCMMRLLQLVYMWRAEDEIIHYAIAVCSNLCSNLCSNWTDVDIALTLH